MSYGLLPPLFFLKGDHDVPDIHQEKKMIVVSFGHTWDYRPGYDDWLSRKRYATKQEAELETARMPWRTLASVRPIIDGYWHIRAIGSVDPITEVREKSPMLYADKPGERPGTTEAESAMTKLLYKLLTSAQQMLCADLRLTAQERSTLDAGWIAEYAFYLPPSLAGALPLERAITWTMPNGDKFKVTVQDITEEGEKQGA